MTDLSVPPTLADEQRALEEASLTAGYEEFTKSLKPGHDGEKRTQGKPYGYTQAGYEFAGRALELFRQSLKDGLDVPAWLRAAHLALDTLLSDPALQVQGYLPLNRLAHAIGARIDQVEQLDSARQAKDLSLERLGYLPRRARSRKAKEILALYPRPRSRAERLEIGATLLHAFVTVDVLAKERIIKHKRTTYVIRLSEQSVEFLGEELTRAANSNGRNAPMVCPPIPWGPSPDGGGFVGGRYLPESGTTLLLSGRGQPHRTIPSPLVLQAVNKLSAQPYRINTRLLAVLEEAGHVDRRDRLDLPGLPNWDSLREPGKVTRDVYLSWPNKQRQKFMADKRNIADTNRTRVEERTKFVAIIDEAKQYANREAIYWPWALDFRGRAYPSCDALNLQGSEISKALLQFAEPEALTDDGERWLLRGLAGVFGLDKQTWEQRDTWGQEHRALIIDSARRPFDGQRLWMRAEEPFLFLALAQDLADGVCRTGVGIDAHASGIQHLSCASRDAEAAAMTNILPSEFRADLYQAIAAEVALAVARLAEDGDKIAPQWHEKITRAVVKSCVMNSPYGITTYGMADDLEEFAEVEPKDKRQVSRWLAHRITEALEKKLVGPSLLMAALQEMARVIASAGRAISWTTPSGLCVVQDYRKAYRHRVRTPAGTLSLRVFDHPSKGPDVAKHVRGVVPNWTHSLDGAHLAATVSQFAGPISTVHDCLTTIPNRLGELHRLAARTFSEQYQRDVVAELWASQAEQHPDLVGQLPLCPERGALDVSAAAASTYLFS